MSYAEVTSALAQLRQYAAECRRKDETEYNGAVAALEGCGNKRSIADSEKESRLNHPGQMIDFVQRLGDSYFKKGFDAPTALADKGAKWSALSDQLAALKTRVNELNASNWQGDAADSYRSQVPTFTADIDNLANLTTSANNGTQEATKDIQVENITFVRTLTTAARPLLTASSKPIHTNWPDSNWWNFNRNAEQYEFTFFTRCAQASEILYGMADAVARQVDEFDPNSNAAAQLTAEVERLGGKVKGNGLNFCLAGPRQAEGGGGTQMS